MCHYDEKASGKRLQLLPSTSRQQLLFWRRCGICHVRMTPEAANRSTAWLACKYHPPAGEQPTASQWEQKALPLVQAVAAGGLYATESKMLGSTKGASDFIFAAAAGSSQHPWVAVEVDGEGHFHKPRGGASQCPQQRRRDKEKDAAAWARLLPTVRLHYQDSHEWAHALAAAQHYVRQGCRAFLLYTSSYPCASRLLPPDGPEREVKWAQVGSLPSWGSAWRGAIRCSRRSKRGPARR